MEKFSISMALSMMLCQYYGFYIFAGWKGVITALINMILYGLIAHLFKVSADKNAELASTYRAQLHNVSQERDRMENDLYNANQQLYIHGLKKR